MNSYKKTQDLHEYGYNGAVSDETTVARVTAVYKERFELISEYGACSGRLKSAAYYGGGEEFPTVGDFVAIDYNPSGDSRITATLPRHSRFARSNYSGHPMGYVKTIIEQLVAANFDYVFIMQSLNHDLNRKRLERYLTLALQSGAEPVIVLTKADVADNREEMLAEIEKASGKTKVFVVSAKTGEGLDALSCYLKKGTTIAFLGSSGVGKSSLVNALAGENVMSVSSIREDDSKGRHTTTHRQLIMLKSGVMIIDTPGMRELGMWEVGEGLSEAFEDVERFLGRCRFADCRHETEPGCAIKAALESGELPTERWTSYCRIKQEAVFNDSKSPAHKKAAALSRKSYEGRNGQ